jgi:heat-inducible transcriptional repressor
MIPERSLEVLRAIVQDYIASKEPVGSKSLVERHSFGVSAATIRNDMAYLEDEDLISAPHTSSGRVPTDKGYRLFVDRLGEVKPISSAEKLAIETFMTNSADLDDVLSRTVRLLSQLTNQVAMVQYPRLGNASIRHFDLIPISDTRVLVMLVTDLGRIQQHVFELGYVLSQEELMNLRGLFSEALIGCELSKVSEIVAHLSAKIAPEYKSTYDAIKVNLIELVDANRQEKIIFAGTSNLSRREEDFPGSVTPVLEAIEEQVVLLKLFTEMQAQAHTVSVRIGRENQLANFSNATVMVSGYENQGTEIAQLGVIGPTRMDYSSNIAAVNAVARYLTKSLGIKGNIG